jgi:O-antigen chain-terminating methyltransferase
MRAVQTRINELDQRLQQLTAELHAKPFEAMLDTQAVADSPYDAFEEIFRGPETRVRELLEPYVDLLRDHAPVLDIGCGRGELLELLRDVRAEARGIDVDQGMVERCRRKGLEVELADAVSYLERQKPRSLGAIFASHVIEHLSYDDLQRLFELSRQTLGRKGVLVVETINVHSLSAFKTFWTDPSHRAPIFPEVAHALALIHGFSRAEIVYPRGTGDSEVDADEATEYALVARID